MNFMRILRIFGWWLSINLWLIGMWTTVTFIRVNWYDADAHIETVDVPRVTTKGRSE